MLLKARSGQGPQSCTPRLAQMQPVHHATLRCTHLPLWLPQLPERDLQAVPRLLILLKCQAGADNPLRQRICQHAPQVVPGEVRDVAKLQVQGPEAEPGTTFLRCGDWILFVNRLHKLRGGRLERE